MHRIRYWLGILTLIVVGCGGSSFDEQDDGGELDASAVDRRTDRTEASSDVPATGDADGAARNDSDTSPPILDGSRDARDASVAEAANDGLADGSSDAWDVSVDSIDASMGADTGADHVDAGAHDGAFDVAHDAIDGGGDAPSAVDAMDTVSFDAGDADGSLPRDDARSDATPIDAPIDAGPDTADAGDACPGICGLVALVITPSSPTLFPHQTRPFQATGEFADGTVHEVTSEVHWTSAQPSVAVVSNAPGLRGLVTVKTPGSFVLGADVGGISTSTIVNVAVVDPAIVAIEPPVLSIAQGTRSRLTTTLTISDGTTQNDTYAPTWQSSDPAVATIDADGIVAALMPGVTTITASSFWMTSTMKLTVTPATLVGISLTPATAVLPVGVLQPVIATGHFSDGSTQDLTVQASWSSSDANRATVESTWNFKRRVSAIAPGPVTITAAIGSVFGVATLGISTATLQSITLSLQSPHLVVDMRLPLQATGHYSDNSTADVTQVVSWASLDPSVASASGPSVYAEQEGTTSVTATFGSVVGSLPIDVRAAVLSSIELSPLAPALAVGTSVPMHAVGHYSDGTVLDLTALAGWYTTMPSVAAIANADGQRGTVIGLAQGTSNIGAGYASKSVSTTATVSP